MGQVRVMQLTIEAPIGDNEIQPELCRALTEYLEACRCRKLGFEQDEVFYASTGTKIVARHFYRERVSSDFWPTVLMPKPVQVKPTLTCLDGGDGSTDP